MESLGLLASSSSLSQAAMSAAVPDVPGEAEEGADAEWRTGTEIPFIVIKGNIVGLQYYSGEVRWKKKFNWTWNPCISSRSLKKSLNFSENFGGSLMKSPWILKMILEFYT